MRVGAGIAALVLLSACSGGHSELFRPPSHTVVVVSPIPQTPPSGICATFTNCEMLFERGGATRSEAQCIAVAARGDARRSMRVAANCVGSLKRLGQIIAAAS